MREATKRKLNYGDTKIVRINNQERRERGKKGIDTVISLFKMEDNKLLPVRYQKSKGVREPKASHKHAQHRGRARKFFCDGKKLENVCSLSLNFERGDRIELELTCQCKKPQEDTSQQIRDGYGKRIQDSTCF